MSPSAAVVFRDGLLALKFMPACVVVFDARQSHPFVLDPAPPTFNSPVLFQVPHVLNEAVVPAVPVGLVANCSVPDESVSDDARPLVIYLYTALLYTFWSRDTDPPLL
jgi:hypothetical protein